MPSSFHEKYSNVRLANCLEYPEFHDSEKIDVNVVDLGSILMFSSVYGACMKTQTVMFVAFTYLRFF